MATVSVQSLTGNILGNGSTMASSPGYGAIPNVTISSGIGASGTLSINPSYTVNTNNTITLGNINGGYGYQQSGLKVQGDADFSGNVKIAGKDIMKLFEKIEERLAILHPNPTLEEKWEQLRDLRKQYIELEAEIKEKEQIWNILKR